MPDDAPRHLDSLTVSKLKSVAEHYNIDISSCKHKKDYVDTLAAAGISEFQVSEALSSDEASAREEAAKAPATVEARREVESIAGKSSGGRVLPAGEDREVERNIDRVLLVRPSFFELDSQVETAWSRMIMADYNDAIRINSDARSKMLDRFSSFQIFSCALSIRAAESIMTSLASAQGKLDPRLKTALAEAKRAFIDGTPKHREQTLEELEALTAKAYESFFEGGSRAEAELRTMLSDYESFGTQTQEPRRLLEIAEQAKQAFNVAEYAKILEDARQAAAGAREMRASEIEKSFGIVRSALHEAREVGAILSVGDDDLTRAKDAFDRQAFKKATDLLASVERTADLAHLERIKDKEARERQTTKVSGAIAGLERTLQEAASYGIDVNEGLLFVSKAKTALVNRDVVNAAKLTRHAKEQTRPIEGELDKERVERGVATKIDDAKCGKCGKEALYSFPNDMRKCIECGHSFSMVVVPKLATMEPIEKPVSTSQGLDHRGVDTQAPSKETPRKGLLARTLKKQ